MATDGNEFVIYACFEKGDDQDHPKSVAICSTMDLVDEHKSRVRAKNDGDADKVKQSADKSEKSDQPSDVEDTSAEVIRLSHRLFESISSYAPLSDLTFQLVPMMKSIIMDRWIYSHCKERLPLLQTDGQFVTYGVASEHQSILDNYLQRVDELDEATRVLPGAILLSLVATFDSFVADLVKTFLKARRDKYAKSDKTLTMSELFAMGSFEEAIAYLIENEVRELMRRSHADQITYIESNFNTKIKEHYDEWPLFIEIFERRNLVAHGKSIVNDIYLSNCAKNGMKIDDLSSGSTLDTDSKYLRDASGRLLEFGMSLAFVLLNKNCPEAIDRSYKHLNQICYLTIKNRNYRPAARLLDFALHRQRADIKEYDKKMMIVNLANAWKSMDEKEKSATLVDSIDWSASADEFRFCIYSLKEDIPNVLALMPKAAQSDKVSKKDFREWPVLRWIRDDDSVKNLFRELYGEPLVWTDTQETNTAEANAPDAELPQNSGSTLH